MTLADTVAKYYALLAAHYDVSAGYTDVVAEEMRAPIKARFQDALRGHRVLEIACGTGYWTMVIAAAAEAVLATDVDPTMISLARRRLAAMPNVRCQIADAYTLNGVRGDFTAAFSHWWWSHIPKSRLEEFLGVLHARLSPGALVVFADQLQYDWINRRQDEEGNSLEQRTLPDGSCLEIVKNFPNEREITDLLASLAKSVRYSEYPDGGYWTVTYKTRPDQQQRAGADLRPVSDRGL